MTLTKEKWNLIWVLVAPVTQKVYQLQCCRPTLTFKLLLKLKSIEDLTSVHTSHPILLILLWLFYANILNSLKLPEANFYYLTFWLCQAILDHSSSSRHWYNRRPPSQGQDFSPFQSRYFHKINCHWDQTRIARHQYFNH